jgi:membrane protein DedA with SNARE-associated domain
LIHAEFVSLIEKYGYLATFVGTLAEGESLLILSGLCAHRGYMSLPVVIAVGAVGGALGDVAFFLLGRFYGAKLLVRYPRYAPAADRVRSMIERVPVATILGVRFMYGLRTVGPAVIGTTRVSLPRFVAFNVVGAVAWSTCWAGAGYLVGKAAEQVLGDLARIEREVFGGALVVIVLAVVAMRVWRRRLDSRGPKT